MQGVVTALVMLALSAAGAAKEKENPVLVDPTTLDPKIQIDIKYATEDNFTKVVLYPVARCLLRPEVAAKVVEAQAYLDAHHPGYVLLLKDCYRPVSVQKKMWEVVKDTPMRNYVANPYSKTGSVHNYGCAVDLTLSKDRKEVDMGTPYDHLGKLAEPRHEERFLKEGELTAQQVAHRRVLRDAMTKGGGFKIIRNEWWHFDAYQGSDLRGRYSKLDVPLDALSSP